MYKQIDLGNGLRLTQSDPKDMGIFLHFKAPKSGFQCGIRLDGHDMDNGSTWAKEMLEDIPDADLE